MSDKPSNLLIDANQRVWIADFGLARIRTDSQLTASGDVLGTLRYLSPEQAKGRRGVVDGRTDIYGDGNFVPLSSAEWTQRWEQLSRAGDPLDGQLAGTSSR